MKTDSIKRNLEEMKKKKADAEYCLANMEDSAGYVGVCVNPPGGKPGEYTIPLASDEMKRFLEGEIEYRGFWIGKLEAMEKREKKENGQ